MTDKKFSEMSYHEFNILRNLVCKEESGNKITDKKIYTDFRISKIYFLDSVTQKRKQMDGIAWLRDRYLSDSELKEKISTQLKWEKENKEQSVNVIEWEKLLATKLFNNPKI